MAEKMLSESAWSSFARKRDLDDAALVKALARLAKADEARPDAQLEALDEIEAQLKKQRGALARSKAAETDRKEIRQRLDEMDAALARQRKLSQAALDAGEEEADSPALATTRMVPLLRELRRGDTRMPALIATAGRDTAVLVMRRPISPARRKLLLDTLRIQGGAKFHAAQCLYEEKALTFVVQTQAAGMAKRLRAALLDQTGLRLKVRVRGDDGSTEEDGEEAAETDTDAPPQVASGTAPTPPDSAAPRPEPADGHQARFRQRLEALGPALQRAFASQAGDVSRMRAVLAFAREKSAAGSHESATAALNALEQLLAAAAAPPPPGPVGGKPPQEGAVDGLPAWEAARQHAVAQLKEIAKEVAAARHPDSAPALIELNAVIKQLTPRPATLQQVAELERYLSQDRVVAEVCEFALDLRTPLLQALAPLKQGLTATA